MKLKKGQGLLGMLLVMSLSLGGTVFAAGPGPVYVESPSGNGGIDYSEQLMRVKGVAPPQRNAENAGESRIFQIRVSKVDAYRNALELIKEVQVDAESTIENFMLSDYVKTKVNGMVRGLKAEGEPKYLSDGSLEQWYIFPLQGNFTGLVLDQVKPASIPDPQRFSDGGTVYTGLIIDARGLGVRPAMAPKILDEDGREVYGSAYVDRKWAIEQGMAGYLKDLEKAKSNDRVTANPIIVKGIKPSGSGRTDIVISNEDAGKIRSNAENLTFIQKCKVIIIL